MDLLLEFLKKLPSWFPGIAMMSLVLLIGIQMYIGDALVCQNGKIFAKTCETPTPTTVTIESLVDQKRIAFQSGTIRPTDWKKIPSKHSGKKMHGIEATVNIDLKKFDNPKIFLSRRGNSHIWETQGLSAYPIRGQRIMDGRSENGFSVSIHGGALHDKQFRESPSPSKILDYARKDQWYVDWLVVGMPRQ